MVSHLPPKFLLIDCKEINVSKNRDGRNPQLLYCNVPVRKDMQPHINVHREQLLTLQPYPKHHI